MSVILSSREFNQQLSQAKKAACRGPVFITSRGKPVHVLLSFEEYSRLSGARGQIADLLAMPDAAEVELVVKRPHDWPRTIDLS